jgi:superfamily II DNA or RNA helicase
VNGGRAINDAGGGAFRTLERLCAATSGGRVTLQIPTAIKSKVESTYCEAIDQLDAFAFWRKDATAPYRPKKGLWLPQRRAIAFAHGYLSARKHRGSDEAALIKMPTGTGKTGVIAALACCSPLLRKTLVLTPRAGLVHQMKLDLTFRFWGRAIEAAYFDSQIHENLGTDELRRIEAEVRKGSIAPVRALAADQYEKIWSERRQARQILVSTFNALHLVLGIEPPAHRSMHGREVRDVASTLKLLGEVEDTIDEKTKEKNVEAFRDLVRSVDAVIVDEGHYEPAYSWSQAVRAIGKPTIIFSATPYRNDYKYFQIAGNYVFNLPWQEAVDQRLVRDVQVKPPIGSQLRASASKSRVTAPAAGYNERSFVQEFAATLAELPKGKKAIVHAATYQSLQRLQRAFFAAGEAAVLIHDAFTGPAKECLDLADLRADQRDALKALRFQHVRHTEGNGAAQAARIWMHQYKLLEGVDDSRFTEIWLYDGFGSARQVVQQIGRAIRRPDLQDRSGQLALVRGSSKRLDVYDGAPTVHEQTLRRWLDYRAYEEYAAKNAGIAFIAETQLLAAVKRTAPAVQYISGEFRGGHLLDQSPTMSAFVVPRRGVVCRVQGALEHKEGAISDGFLDNLQAEAMEAMLLEERFDIAPVPVPAPDRRDFQDVRLIRYLAWSNSPYLARHHIPEWRLGVMVMVRAGRYIFLLDTEGICLDYNRLGLLSPESKELKRLFRKPARGRRSGPAQQGTRIIETTASGLDISELGLRSISVRKYALDEGYFDLAEASQVPTSVRGFGQLGARTARRRLSFARSSVADATNQLLTVKDYAGWARIVADAMADDRIEPHEYFGRFAREVSALDPDAGVPTSILLDLWDLLDVSSETTGERHWDKDAVDEILSYDTCCEVTDRQTKDGAPPRYCFDFGPYELEVKYIYRSSVPPAGRYAILGEPLNEAVAEAEDDLGDREIDPDNRMFGRRLSTSLTRLINQEQSFRIIPSQDKVVYSHSHFYKPEVNEAVLSILEPCAALDDVVSEKGDTRVDDRSKWGQSTLFGLVYGWLEGGSTASDPFAEDINGCETVICDDRTDETADFYGINSVARRVLVVHAKAEDGTPGISARKLQEVTRQAQASLAFAGSSRREFAFPSKWKNDWEVTLQAARGTKIARPRLVTREKKLDIQGAHARLIAALANPAYTKEVIMLTGGILSAGAARSAHGSAEPRDLQFLYFLASVRSTFDRAGVRFRIICNP